MTLFYRYSLQRSGENDRARTYKNLKKTSTCCFFRIKFDFYDAKEYKTCEINTENWILAFRHNAPLYVISSEPFYEW